MTTPIIPRWAILTDEARADAVIDWCQQNGIDTSSIVDYQLAAAMAAWSDSMHQERVDMGEGYPHEASPADYVHQIRAIAAFLRSRI